MWRPRRFVSYGHPLQILILTTISGCVAHCNLTAQASRLSNYILQRSFFFFARMSCSEQSTFHGQASDRVWSFPKCSFKASRRKRRKKENAKKKRGNSCCKKAARYFRFSQFVEFIDNLHLSHVGPCCVLGHFQNNVSFSAVLSRPNI